jgi:hypothetical protein
MTEHTVLHDQLVLFMQQEHRGGFMLADPLTANLAKISGVFVTFGEIGQYRA